MPTADIDGVSVDYTDTGAGTPLLFVPGLVGSKEWFRFQSSGLSDRYRVITPNLRRCRRGAGYTIDDLAEDVARLLAHLRVPAAVVAGHDFGALVAARFALLRPERCLALVLLGAAPGFTTISAEQILSDLAPGTIQLDSWWNRLRRRLKPEPAESDEDVGSLAFLARNNARLSKPTLRARLKIMSSFDLSDQIAELQAPTLVIAGSGDHPHILAGSQALHERISDSTLEVVEDADHYCFHTRHDLVNTIIDDYVEARITAI